MSWCAPPASRCPTACNEHALRQVVDVERTALLAAVAAKRAVWQLQNSAGDVPIAIRHCFDAVALLHGRPASVGLTAVLLYVVGRVCEPRNEPKHALRYYARALDELDCFTGADWRCDDSCRSGLVAPSAPNAAPCAILQRRRCNDKRCNDQSSDCLLHVC